MKAQTGLKFALAAAAVLLAACGKTKVVEPVVGNGGAGLTSVSIGLPDRSSKKDEVADIETKMNGYHLTIEPVDAACAGATKVSKVADYTNTVTLTESLKQGCDYNITLALGNKGGAAAQPAQPAPSYEGKIKALLQAECTACHKPGNKSPDLTTAEAAKKYGARVYARVQAGTMPPSGALGADDKASLKAWADAGYPEKDQSSAGSGSTSADKLGAVYYKNDPVFRIKKEDILGKATFAATLNLTLQADGKAIGLKPGTANSGGSSAADAVKPDPQPEPAKPTVSLGDKDFALTTSAGKEEKASEIFKGKYMLMDFSSSGCIYCVQRAGEVNADAQLQKLLDGTNCSHATFVPEGDLESWQGRVNGASSFVGKHSYALTSSRMGNIVEAFGVSFTGTPTFVLIDQNGKAMHLADPNGVPEAELRQYCK